MNQSVQYSNKSSNKHLFWMTICCLAVIGAIIILPRYFNIGTLGLILLVLLCPIFHYFMMRKMHKKDEEHGDTKNIKK